MFQKILFVFALIAIGDAITFDKQINIRSESDPINRSKQNLLSTIMVLLANGSDRPVSLRSTPVIAEPNDYKKSIGDVVSQKSSYLTAFGPMLLESMFNDAFKTGDELVKNKIDSITDVSQQFVSGVKTAGKLAVGLAVKGVKKVTKGVTVIKGILLKPVFFVVGSQMKILGSGLKALGTGTQFVGTAIKDAGKAVKGGALRSVGFGATVISRGTDPFSIPSQPSLELDEPIELFNTTEPSSNKPIDQSFKKPNPTLSAPQLPTHY